MRAPDRGHLIFTLVLALFVVIVLTGSFEYRTELRTIPVVVAIPTLILLISILVRDFVSKTKERVEGDNVKQKFVIRIMGWMVLFSGAILCLGFFVSVPLFVFVFLLTEAQLRWSSSIIASVVITGAFLIIFCLGLKITLWPGIIPEVLPKILGGGLLPPV